MKFKKRVEIFQSTWENELKTIIFGPIPPFSQVSNIILRDLEKSELERENMKD